jgi:uncharacterized protein YegL
MVETIRLIDDLYKGFYTMRRLPVYILLDTSGSMRGEPIHSVNVGLQSMLSALRQDPYALESVHLSIITFDLEAKVYLSLTPLDQVQLSNIDVPSAGQPLWALLWSCWQNK